MKVVTDDRVALFVGQRVNQRIVPPFTVMGIEQGGEIIAGVVFNHFTGCDLHVTIAGHGWTKGFLADVGQYVFGQLKCLRITVITEQKPVISIAKRLGAKTEGRMRNHFGPGRHGVVLGILREDWKF